MTVEVLDYRIKQLASITWLCVLDDESFDDALFELIKKYNTLKKNNTFLKSELNKNGIKTNSVLINTIISTE